MCSDKGAALFATETYPGTFRGARFAALAANVLLKFEFDSELRLGKLLLEKIDLYGQNETNAPQGFVQHLFRCACRTQSLNIEEAFLSYTLKYIEIAVKTDWHKQREIKRAWNFKCTLDGFRELSLSPFIECLLGTLNILFSPFPFSASSGSVRFNMRWSLSRFDGVLIAVGVRMLP